MHSSNMKLQSKENDTRLHEGNFGPYGVHLPNVQLLVLLDHVVNLIRLETLASTALQDIRHFDHLAVARELADYLVYLVFVLVGPVYRLDLVRVVD